MAAQSISHCWRIAVDKMNDQYWDDLFQKLDNMSDEEFACLLEELDAQKDIAFAIK